MLWQLLLGILVIQSTAVAGDSRVARSLAGTFPFADHGSHHHSHSAGRQGFAEDGQGLEEDNSVPGLDTIAQAGERCVEKVMMIEEMTYDDQIVCHHSYSKKCHTTYITAFEAVQMEKCEEYFEKHCVIEYKKMAEGEEVEVCNEYFERNCDTPGPTVCE